MNSKTLLEIKSELKEYLKDKNILDIILFGSVAKGSPSNSDIDIAVITDSEIKINKEKFHIALIKTKQFFDKPISLINTLFREGYSLKHNKYFSEIYGFEPKVLFSYNLLNLSPSIKVKIVNSLRGIKKQKGLVEENLGEWVANQVFIIPSSNEKLFEKFFINNKINFNKKYLLIH